MSDARQAVTAQVAGQVPAQERYQGRWDGHDADGAFGAVLERLRLVGISAAVQAVAVQGQAADSVRFPSQRTGGRSRGGAR